MLVSVPAERSGGKGEAVTTSGARAQRNSPMDRTAVLAAGVTVLAWASAFVAIRVLAGSFGAGQLALGRLLIGALALGAVLLLRRRWVPPTRREWVLVVVCGLAWFAVYNVALNAAEARLDAGTAAMLVNVAPVLIALSAGVLLGEGFSRWLLAGAAVALVGAVLVGAATRGEARADLTGVALALLAAVTYAVGVLTQKPVLRRLPPLQVTFLACAVGAAACLPFSPGLLDALATAGPGAVAGLVYLGLVPTAVAFGTWAVALARTDAGRLGVSTYLVPALTVVLAWPVLGETPPPLALAGGALCLAGVALTRRR